MPYETQGFTLDDSGQRIVMVDCNSADQFGGLANNAFGGLLLNGTREQKQLGVKDSPELMHADWLRAAEFGEQQRISVGYMSGRSNVVFWLDQHGYQDAADALVDHVFEQAKKSDHLMDDDELHAIVRAFEATNA